MQFPLELLCIYEMSLKPFLNSNFNEDALIAAGTSLHNFTPRILLSHFVALLDDNENLQLLRFRTAPRLLGRKKLLSH